MNSVFRISGIILLGIIIVFGIGLRVYHPEADPPPWLYIYNTDEGHYSYCTQNKIKYGNWFVNDAKYALITPLFNLSQYLISIPFACHQNIVCYRAVSMVCGVLYCIMLAFLFERKSIRLAAIAFGSISFMGIIHSRMGIPEMMLTLSFLLTALLAIEAFRRGSRSLYAITGVSAVAGVAIKPTGMMMLFVILSIPFFYRSMGSERLKYLMGTITGMFIGALIFILIIVIPHYADWLDMLSAATQYGSKSVPDNITGWITSLFFFILSPALQTMPIFWPLSLVWCILIFLPRFINKQISFQDTLIFLWLGFGIGMLGIPSYQPARWQLLIFPPVLNAGILFIQYNRNRLLTVGAVSLIVAIAALSAYFNHGNILILDGDIHPGGGLFSHWILLTAAIVVFFSTLFVLKKTKLSWTTGFLYSALLLEITLQITLNVTYTIPSLYKQNQWYPCARGLEELVQSDTDIFSGSMVQDFSLRADIRVLPTYYTLSMDNDLGDEAVRIFFVRQNVTPTYFILLDIERKLWEKKAPIFMRSLKAIGKCRLLIGGLGLRYLYVYKFKSYDWLTENKQTKTQWPSIRANFENYSQNTRSSNSF